MITNKTVMSWFYCALTILFIYLKLTHEIDWNWPAVLSPLWGPWVAGLLILVWVDLYHQFLEPEEKKKKRMAREQVNRFYERLFT
jgi:hypothetical protein